MHRNISGFCFAIITALVLAAPAYGDEAGTPSNIKTTNIWVRATPPGMTNTAAYVSISNQGETADRLLSVSSPSARVVEIHQVLKDGDLLRMQPVSGGVSLPAGGTVHFKPGVYHIMLIDIEKPIKVGDVLDLTFTFEHAPRIRVSAVASKNGASAGHDHATHKMKPGHHNSDRKMHSEHHGAGYKMNSGHHDSDRKMHSEHHGAGHEKRSGHTGKGHAPE